MIAIVDYGLGNIKAFANIYKKLNVPFVIATSKSDLLTADHFILPGVGAFDSAIQKFNASGMRETLEQLVLGEKRPLLGICVGMQMLANGSEEGQEQGLGWISGFVRKLDASRIPFRTKLPHMGWNDVEIRVPSPLTKDFESKSSFYFLHSYFFDCSESTQVLGVAQYGVEFAAVVGKANIFGIQCHPEKSHSSGIALLKNFAEV